MKNRNSIAKEIVRELRGGNKMKKVTIITWNTNGAGEPDDCYRIDRKGEGERFFRVLLDNAEADGRDIFHLKKIPFKEWIEIEKAGREMA